MKKKSRRKRLPKAILPIAVALVFLSALWLGLSALFSAAPPINYVTSCSMYPEYSRGDLLLVLPLSPSVPIEPYGGSLAEAHPWVVSYGNNTTTLESSISAYCNNSAEQMCRLFYSDPAGFSETNGPVTYEYAKCDTRIVGAPKEEPCVSSVRAGNASFATTEKPQSIAYSARVFSSAPAVQIIHRAFFGIRDASGNAHFFTKGDANTLFDSQAKEFFSLNAAAAANESSVRGVVIAKIPFAGELLRGYGKVEGCEGSQLIIR